MRKHSHSYRTTSQMNLLALSAPSQCCPNPNVTLTKLCLLTQSDVQKFCCLTFTDPKYRVSPFNALSMAVTGCPCGRRHSGQQSCNTQRKNKKRHPGE